MKADTILGPAVTEWQNNRDTEDSTLMSILYLLKSLVANFVSI